MKQLKQQINYTMIKPSDLRLNNFVQDSEGTIGVVTMITKTYIEVLHEEGNNLLEFESEQLNPIPLTEEWLIKFGGVKNYFCGIDLWICNDFLIEFNEVFKKMFVFTPGISKGY